MTNGTTIIQHTAASIRSGMLDTPESNPLKELSKEELQQQYELLLQQYRILQQKYSLLANSKAGRFTLAYWRIKDMVKRRITAFMKEGFVRKKRKPIPTNLLPSITVIIPTYKENPYVDCAVSSVFEQDYPKEKITVIISVNGADRTYFEKLNKQYRNWSCVKILYTEKQGAAAARNQALAETETECVCFLDDDDWLTKGYLRSMAIRMYQDVSVVFSPLCDYNEGAGNCTRETYINQTLCAVGSGVHRRNLHLAPLMSSLPAKLYRTKMLKTDFKPLDERIRSAEDVIYWAENYSALHGRLYLCEADQEDCYIRRMTAGSLSRPHSHEWRVYISDRLEVIERLGALLDKAAFEEERKFISSKIAAQKNLLEQYIATLEETQREGAEEMITYFKSFQS